MRTAEGKFRNSERDVDLEDRCTGRPEIACEANACVHLSAT